MLDLITCMSSIHWPLADSWCISQSMVDWGEETWTIQLFHCLKEHEQDLKVQIVNISQRGPKWTEWLQTIFFSPSITTSCTIFKGVTDIVILGRNGFVSLNEDIHSCLVEFLSAVFVVEVGVNNKKKTKCVKGLVFIFLIN